ncbi:IS4 family transposase [Methanobrevibacter curvatus]|uniref:Transposase DDE domain protein n=1 Tax=Methanobrevibacter curvatus TaxID=49547 RepID=A0A166E9D0_9EURY|nr:IS4 family transposase [Methanobrevibacter curvatus]KZX16414.1 transposase DDE domain protein [Methanobrevibacter curvatus]
MHGTIRRMISLFAYIKSKEAVEYGRMYKSAFTRESPLNFENSILIHINKHGLTNHMELRNYFKKIGKISISKQAFSKSKEKLNPNVFKNLNNHLLTKFYGSNEVKKFKNHLILSGDGSKSTLPYNKTLENIFGGIINKFQELTSVAINLTTIYDCLNGFIIDLELDKYKTSEKELINRNMDNITKLDYLKDTKKIFICDRGFPSIEFFNYLLEKNEKFIFRIRKNSYKAEKTIMKTNDEFIDININKTRLNHIKNKELKEKLLKKEKLNLRITKITLPTGEEEHLISNLNKKTFTSNDLKELYNLKWGIEVSYDSLKNLFAIENVSGYSEIAVKQDYLSQILAYNIVNDLENTAQKILNQKTQNTKDPKPKKKKINKNIALGIIKEELIKITRLTEENTQKEKLIELIQEISKTYTQTSTTKSPRKPKRAYSTKNRTNNRKSF